jgi:FKBP-type peptidyl-prolyl cis-trans isomerase FkpA
MTRLLTLLCAALTATAPAVASDVQPASAPASTPASAATPVPANDIVARAAREPGAVLTPSGMVFQVLREGHGVMPLLTDYVRVHYVGTFPDGREFDSSIRRGVPAVFGLTRVIKCWTEGLQRIKVGGKARLTCPPAVAYGDRGAGNVIPPNATLIFEVELLAIRGL